MITKRFDPQLLVFDAIRRNHPADLAKVLERLVTHLLGVQNFVPSGRFIEHCAKFMRDDSKMRTEPLELHIIGDTKLIIMPDGRLHFEDHTEDRRFVPLWIALIWPEDVPGSEQYGINDDDAAETD